MDRSVPVKDAMTVNVLTAGPQKTVAKAAEVMTENGVGSLVIVRENKPIGIVTERDILDKVVSSDLKPSEVRVSNVMSKPLITVKPEFDMLDAMRLMVKNRIRRLPVVQDEELVGIVTAQDVTEVSPQILEVIPEREEIEPPEEVEESVCEVCGEARKSLYEWNGKWICDECRDYLVG
ncbi:MAG: CBS domain-containing protein [Hadesarchaea archaeon]|nr:CBS domain-containing protein [Hadesarchaea archaeon]